MSRSVETMRKFFFCLILSCAVGCTPSSPPAPTSTPGQIPSPVVTATATATPSPEATPQVDMSDWKEFVAPDQSFKVMFPGTVEVDHSAEESEGGTVNHFGVQVKLKEDLCAMEWREYPDVEKATAFYDQHIDDIREMAGNLLLEQRPVQLDGHKGIQFKFLSPDEKDAFYEAVFLVGSRYYSVVVEDKDNDGDVNNHVEAVVATFKFTE